MSEELIVFLATIYGEAASCSVEAWKAIASVIVNRKGKREWKKHKDILSLIQKSRFDAFDQKNKPYKEAFTYFKNIQMLRTQKLNIHLKHLAEAVLPIYAGIEKPVPDIILYYSPLAMLYLHQKNPKLYTKVIPKWDFSLLQEVKVKGCEKDDFIFLKYK